MKREEMVNRLLKINRDVQSLMQELEIMDEEIDEKATTMQRILQIMVRNKVDLFAMDLMTASDIADTLSLSHKLCPDLLRDARIEPRPRKVTAIQAGILAKKMPQAKRFSVVKGKHHMRMWALHGDYMRYSLVSSVQMYEHYQIQLEEMIVKLSNSKEKLAANPPPDDEIDPPNFL